MRQLLRLIESLADVFDRLGLRYAFGGALANNYWGIVRTTQDADCLVHIPAVKYQLLADELTQLGCVMRDQDGSEQLVTVAAMRQQEQEQKMIELWHHGMRAELFVPALPLQGEILRRAVRMPFGTRSIAVTTAEELILLKMAFHREKDLLDVRGILWVQRGKLDLGYMRSWSERMLKEDVQCELENLIQQYQEKR